MIITSAAAGESKVFSIRCVNLSDSPIAPDYLNVSCPTSYVLRNLTVGEYLLVVNMSHHDVDVSIEGGIIYLITNQTYKDIETIRIKCGNSC